MIEQKQNECRVCGSLKPSHENYCAECIKWKEQAENRRKAIARRKAFGELL